MPLNWNSLNEPAEVVAPRLLGCELVLGKMRGRIVETEAYHQADAASHSFKGETPRTAVMFGPAGHLYVYFTYGMHYCCNIVTGPAGEGSAVLLRAIEPLEGISSMSQNRRGIEGSAIANGPAKLCQAFGIDKALNGHDLITEPLRLELHEPLAQTDIVTTTRVGISREKDAPLRFYIKGNKYVSKL